MGESWLFFSVFFTIIIKERKNKGLRVRIAENIRPPFAVRLWNQLQNCLYHPEMELIYDYVTSRNPRHRFDHLPSPEEVAANFPNPCGWSTGMEDCMLNAGSALDILRLRREDEGGTREETAFACHLLNGIHRCATVHGRSGFIARGITPRDGKSCYGNSSRDQFTLAVYGVWRFLRAFSDAPEPARRNARELLRAVARYCEAAVTPERGYDLGRLDGGRAVVSKMWQCDAHEVLRLPMIYAAAFEATGERHWLNAAKHYAAPGVEETLKVTSRECGWDIPIAQVQLSLRFFRESNLFPELRRSVSSAMERVTCFARPLLRRQLAAALSFSGDWGTLYENWRLLPMRITPQTLSADGHSAIFDGRTYLNPCFGAAYAEPNSYLRSIGNCLTAVLMDDNATLSSAELVPLRQILERVDFSRCSGSGVIQLLHGCQLALHRGFHCLSSDCTTTKEVLHEEDIYAH